MYMYHTRIVPVKLTMKSSVITVAQVWKCFVLVKKYIYTSILLIILVPEIICHVNSNC